MLKRTGVRGFDSGPGTTSLNNLRVCIREPARPRAGMLKGADVRGFGSGFGHLIL